MARANGEGWTTRLHAQQLRAEEEGDPTEVDLVGLVLESHAELLTEILRIQRHLKIAGSEEPASD